MGKRSQQLFATLPVAYCRLVKRNLIGHREVNPGSALPEGTSGLHRPPHMTNY